MNESDSANEGDSAQLAAAVERRNASFLRDLEAANALKGFLVGNGIEVPKELLAGLAELTEIYLSPVPVAASPVLEASPPLMNPDPASPP